eukprot:scaffold19_cov114-Cylindrotheca_fusiformis.AAC.52
MCSRPWSVYRRRPTKLSRQLTRGDCCQLTHSTTWQLNTMALLTNRKLAYEAPLTNPSALHPKTTRNNGRSGLGFEFRRKEKTTAIHRDDWTLKVVGKLNPLVNTPNIDHMADNGIMFTQNCVTTSVCWMSRATLMTGLYSARHRQTEIGKTHNIFNLHPWNETLFPLLKQKGYYTGIVGKWHGPQVKDKLDMAFDHMLMYYGKHWVSRDGQTRHVTDLNREDALDFLRRRPKDQKFALKVSFFATYPSYQPMNESKVWYSNVTVPMPKTNTEHHFKLLPPFFTNRNEGRNRWRKRFEPSYYQESIKDLYRMATEVDFAVGEIISELKEQGVFENTLLIFTTDNGNFHGEKSSDLNSKVSTGSRKNGTPLKNRSECH